MNHDAEVLDRTLAAFVSALDLDFEKLRDTAPAFLGLFTEAALSVIVLEYALRKKGLLSDDDVARALEEAQEAVQRIRARGGGLPVGTA